MCEWDHDNQLVELKVPDTVALRYNSPEKEPRLSVCVDACLVDEITELWAEGVVTEGCCCGHRQYHFLAHIAVDGQSAQRMRDLGYVESPYRAGFFIPKTSIARWSKDDLVAALVGMANERERMSNIILTDNE